MILHIVDITHENVAQQVTTVLEVLADLEATSQPILTALNKVDALPPESADWNLQNTGLQNTIAISALTGAGIPDLLVGIEELLDEELVFVDVILPYARGDLLGLFHKRGTITRESHEAAGTRVSGRVPGSLLPRLEPYLAAGGRPLPSV